MRRQPTDRLVHDLTTAARALRHLPRREEYERWHRAHPDAVPAEMIQRRFGDWTLALQVATSAMNEGKEDES